MSSQHKLTPEKSNSPELSTHTVSNSDLAETPLLNSENNNSNANLSNASIKDRNSIDGIVEGSAADSGWLSSKKNTAAANSIHSSDAVMSQSQQSELSNETSNNTLHGKVKGYLNPWGIWNNRSREDTKSNIGDIKEGTPIPSELSPTAPATEPEEEVHSTPPPFEPTPSLPPTANNITTKIIIQSPTLAVVEETVTSADTENVQPDKPNANVPTDPQNDTNFIWNITKRVSLIPFLPPSLGFEGQSPADELPPNKCSPVIDNHQFTATGNAFLNSGSHKTTNADDAVKESLWWTRWTWRYNRDGGDIEESVSDLGSGIIEDELLKVQRREIANQIKCQSYGIPKSVVWGIFNPAEETEFGYVRITGNTYKKPVILKKMPPSAFELNEKQLVTITDKNTNNNGNALTTVEPIVLPDIEWNYRDFTLRTKCRIALSKVPALQSLFTPQAHLYYDDHKKRNKGKKKRVEKKAIVICFHGFLPQKISKNIIGESTGTAEQMKDAAVKELQRWSDIQNIDLNIDTICLEGYGKLFERVNECLSILESWIDTFSCCDYILTVSNSHNIPLTIHVIARLITSGYFDRAEKLGFIGFSGLSMGPIPEVESKISTRGSVGQDNDIISELFDFQDPESLQSKELVRNMRILIKKNFKVTFIGSLNDCFTPLYSSLALHLIHPNIYRVIYIDGSQHQPDFLTSLFNLILTVKNLNYSDHGLLLELSSFFTGAIGDGQHSRVLKNKYGYRVGINNMLNTSDLFYQRKLYEELTNIREYATNSYHIPWCLRGFLEELEKLQKHFDVRQIIDQLYEEFKSWEPETQKMKDLRYCMLAFESVLNEDLGL